MTGPAAEQPAEADHGAAGQLEAIAARVTALAEDAVVWSVAELVRRHALTGPLPDLKARFQTRGDFHYHVGFLAGALETGEPLYFTDYVSWLARVLASRGVPQDALVDSLAVLARFFNDHLEAPFNAAVVDVLAAGMARARQIAPDDARSPRQEPVSPEAEALARCLLAGDRNGARAILFAAAGGEDAYLRGATRLVQPALYWIGELWQYNHITVGQEHLATALSRSLLEELLLYTARRSKPLGRRALFAAVERDRHVLGVRIVADAFQLKGWDVQYLGSDTPQESLIAQIERWRPDVAGLSVSLVQHLPVLKRVITAVRGEFGSQAPVILVGGLPTNRIEGIWRWAGADAWSPDASRAAEMLT